MAFMSKDSKEIVVGSLWKFTGWTDKQRPNVTGENQDFVVGRVRQGTVDFGRHNEPNRHSYNIARFLDELVSIRDPSIKLKTQLFAALGPLRGCPDLKEDYQNLLMELDI